MKNRLFVCIAALSIGFASCTKEEDEAFTAGNAKISNEIDRIADDVSAIAEQEYQDRDAAEGRPATAGEFLPSCAQVTTTFTEDTWTSVIDFGADGCVLDSGATVTGQIIVSGSTDFDSESYEVEYTFNNFFHNNRQVEGSRSVTFTRESTAAQAELHTVANIDIDFTITYPNGNEYHRTGHRVRELIEGYNTPFNWTDNVYQVSGNWSTTGPNGTWTTTIGTPLVWHVTCPYIGSGTLTFATANNTATLDYGDGTCDYFAQLAVNNGSPTTVLLN